MTKLVKIKTYTIEAKSTKKDEMQCDANIMYKNVF